MDKAQRAILGQLRLCKVQLQHAQQVLEYAAKKLGTTTAALESDCRMDGIKAARKKPKTD